MKLNTNSKTESARKAIKHKINKPIYQKPRLICYGDVRDVTLGGSPGGGDSGSPRTERRRP